ncbi:MAG: hypothetical protein AAF571_07590 [Verrucomicrobiota bacterium]
MKSAGKLGSASFWLLLIGGVLAILLVGGYFGFYWGKGTSSRTLQGSGFTSSQSGWELGFKEFTLQAGQVIQVEYELTERKAGELLIKFWKQPAMGLAKVVKTRKVSITGKGSYTFSAPTAGRYRIEFDAMPDGNGYHLSYRADWQVQAK